MWYIVVDLNLRSDQMVEVAIQRNQDDQGLFQYVDDSIIQKICVLMIQEERYHDIGSLIKTNSRFKGACQGTLHDVYQRFKNQPPTEIDQYGAHQWLDSEGRLHRNWDLPAVIEQNGSMAWCQHGQLHRDGDRPARFRSRGTNEWWIHNQKHRDGDLPSVVDKDGSKIWYQHDQIHRDEDRPAVVNSNGDQIWYQSGEIHRDGDRPAVIQRYGLQVWYSHGLISREGDHPAVITPKIKVWIEHGIPLRINNVVLPHDKDGNTYIEDLRSRKQIKFNHYTRLFEIPDTYPEDGLFISAFRGSFYIFPDGTIEITTTY